MKISCTQENLNKGLGIVGHISNKNTSLPILNNVLLQTAEKTLKLRATNLEIGITHLVRCKTIEDGEIAVEAKIFADYINLLPKNNIELETEKSNLLISCGNYTTQINGNQTDDFPLIPTIQKSGGYKIGLADFKNGLSQTIFAASVNDLRQEISGTFFSFSNSDKKMTIVATDSYRLAEKIIDFTPLDNNENNIIAPLRTVQEILRILNLNEDVLNENSDVASINLYIDDNQILLENNNTELVSKLVEGQYPDYKQIIPKDSKTNIIINKNELQKAVKTASLFAKSGIYDIELKISLKDNELEIFSENSQLGRNSIKISAQVSGEDNGIVLNFRYLLDGLQNINTDQVSIDIIDMATPCVIRPYKDEKVDQNYLYLIMPIRQ